MKNDVMKTLVLKLIVCTCIISANAQTQIGQDVDGSNGGRLGSSVSLNANGTIFVAGAPFDDYVRVYQNNSGTWTQVGSDITAESSGDSFGWSVSISADGNTIAIGGTSNDDNGTDAGHVRVFQNNAGTWTQVGQDIDGEAAGDFFGQSVSISADGSIVAVGASLNDGNGSNSGHVRVFENIAGTWTQIGQDIDGEGSGDRSGASISLSSDGNFVAIGATENISNGMRPGQVRVYENVAGTWTQVGQDIDGEATSDDFGSAVSLNSDGTIVAVGASSNDGNGNKSGHVRVYENTGGTWTQVGQDMDGEASNDFSGFSVSINADGTVVAIGAPENDNANGSGSGHVRVYENTGGTWSLRGSDIDGESGGDESGQSVSLSSDGSILAIGADDSGGNNGQVRVYDLAAVLSVENNSGLPEIMLYPNPASNYITVTGVDVKELILFDLHGRKIATSSTKDLALSDFAKGIYLLTISDKNRRISKRKVIIE